MEELSKSAMQAGVTIDISRKLESILAQLGASGKGLHEKVTSVQHLLPPRLMGKLRYVATVRNKLSHDDVVMADAEFKSFVGSARVTLEELRRIAVRLQPGQVVRTENVARAGLGKWLLVGVVILLLLIYFSRGSKPAEPAAADSIPAESALVAPEPEPAPVLPAAVLAKPAMKKPRKASSASVRPAPSISAKSVDGENAPASGAMPAASLETIRNLTEGL